MKLLRKDLIHGQAFKYITFKGIPLIADDNHPLSGVVDRQPPTGWRYSYTKHMTAFADKSFESEVEILPHPETGYYRIPRKQVRVGECFRYVTDKIKYCRIDQGRLVLPNPWHSASGDGAGLILGSLVELIPNWSQIAGVIPSPYQPVSMPEGLDLRDALKPAAVNALSLYDGLTKEECLRRFDEACRHDWIRKDANGNLHVPNGGFASLTVIQAKAAMAYRKEILGLRVKRTEAASRERDRLQVVCDANDLDE